MATTSGFASRLLDPFGLLCVSGFHLLRFYRWFEGVSQSQSECLCNMSWMKELAIAHLWLL